LLFGIWSAREGLMRPMGARTTRSIIDMRWTWPAPDRRNESIFKMAETWRAAGVEPIVCFRGFAAWASGAPEGGSHSHYPPRDWAVWEQYVRWLVNGFKDSCHIWEVWNEPYPNSGWKGTRDDLITMHAIVYRVVKSIQPEGIVLGPCFNFSTPSHRAELEALLELGLAKHIDAIADHPYRPGRVAPELTNFLAEIRDLQRLVGRYGIKGIYFTEMGFSAKPGGDVTEREQADFIARSFILAKVAGVRAMTWHNLVEWVGGPSLTERNYGIVHVRDTDGVLEPRPAYVAFGVTNRHLHDATLRRELDFLGATGRGYVFERAGQPIVALWDFGDKPREVTLDVGADEVTVADLMDVQRRVNTPGGRLRLTLDGSPKFVHGASAALLTDVRLVRAEPEVVDVFPGQKATAKLTITNVSAKPQRLQWSFEPPDGWTLKLSHYDAQLAPKATAQASVELAAPTTAAYGDAAALGRVRADGKLVGTFALRVRVAPRLMLTSLQPAFVAADAPAVAIGLQANDDVAKGAKAEVWIGDESAARVTLPAMKRGESRVQVVPLAPGRVRLGSAETIKVSLAAAGAAAVEREQRLAFAPCVRVKPNAITIDGQLDDWPQQFIYFCDEWLVFKPERWRDPHDLSASFAASWDAERLYLAVLVVDDVHVQDRAPGDVWAQDNIQLHINPAPDAQRDGRRPTCFEYGLSLTPRGPEVFRWMNPAGAASGVVKSVALAARRLGRTTLYEAAFPLAEIGRKQLRAGDRLGFALAVNDSDGSGRKAISWFGGIVEGKMPERHGVIVLTE